MGGGEDFLVVGPEPQDEQGLREAVRQRGSVRLRGHDPPDGEEAGSWRRICEQFGKGYSRNCAWGGFSEVRQRSPRCWMRALPLYARVLLPLRAEISQDGEGFE